MAKRKRSSRGFRKNKRRKFHRKRNFFPLTRSLGPLRTKQLVKFNYAENFALNPGVAGTAASYVYSMNGLYDPNITGTGHQPRGFDQIMTLYDHYVVIGCKVDFQFWCADTTYGHMITAHIQDDATTDTDPENLLERRFLKKKVVASRNGGIDNGRIVMNVNPNKFLARSKPLSDPDLKGTTAANPTEQCYLHLNCFPMQGGADGGGVYCYIRLTYTAVLIEPRQPGKS